ncbi:ras-related protein Rab-39B-like isoform X2 [Xenia sp. Carnegie-2017]|uniref:ras-related protein Rab-39B-like isoform X2 n=1 Tax=Xenia sp. Carnegie-2017 TaxID=2897299 RepID=UPI001F03D40D|nr:ras-related protein Rab-39B-like isoform X2 [Xenia sp. Carnegie-2017]
MNDKSCSVSRTSSSSSPPKTPKYFYQFRFIVIGDSMVGKSSIIRQFTEGNFIDIADTTVGVDFHARIVELSEVKVKIQVWDTAGQERFRSITFSYYRDAVGCLIIYDITKKDSFYNITEWYKEAKENVNEEECVFMLIGHKIDKESERKVSTAEGERFADAHDMFFIETSAKILCNVEEAFNIVAKEVYKRLVRGQLEMKPDWDGIKTVSTQPAELVGLDRIPSVDMLVEERPNKKCC